MQTIKIKNQILRTRTSFPTKENTMRGLREDAVVLFSFINQNYAMCTAMQILVFHGSFSNKGFNNVLNVCKESTDLMNHKITAKKNRGYRVTDTRK